MKIYVASSWKNPYVSSILTLLRRLRHEVYDFKASGPFNWVATEDYEIWTPTHCREQLDKPEPSIAFNLDMNALKQCEALLLVSPCGRSAHLEAGYAVAAGKITAAFIPETQKPELMYKMFNDVLVSMSELKNWGDKILCGWKPPF